MKRIIQDLSFQFRSLREWVLCCGGKTARGKKRGKEAEEALGSQCLVCLGPVDLSGPCSKGGAWIEEKIDDRVWRAIQ